MSTNNCTAYKDKGSWLCGRMDGIGASDAAAIVNASPYKSALELFYEKHAKEIPEESGIIERFYWGHSLENNIAQRFVEETGLEITNPGEFTIYRNKDYPFIQATPDRLVVKDGIDLIPLELKTVSPYTADQWDEDIPLHYKVQLQHQMLVMGAPYGYLASLIGFDQYKIFEDTRDEDFIKSLIQQESDFWNKMLKDIPPVPDGSESCKQMLLKHHPDDNGEKIILPLESVEWFIELQAAKDSIKNLEELKQSYENKIKAAMGDNTFGILPDNVAQYSWKTQEKAPHKVKGSKTRVLRVSNIK